MAESEHLLPTLKYIEALIEKQIQADAVLSARIDAQVKASTDSDADYAAEVVDGRVDIWGHEHGSLGANIREGQMRISVNQKILQGQINSLAEAVLETLAIISENRERQGGIN